MNGALNHDNKVNRRTFARSIGALFALVLWSPVMASCARETSAAQFPVIHQVAGGASEVFANAYIIEGESGVVVVDALLTRTGSRDLRRRVDALGKPLLAVVLTHGHPDHYGGVTQLVEGLPEAQVIAVQGVDAVIRRDDAMKGARLAEFGIDWAPTRTFPNTIAVANSPLTFGEFTLTPVALGAGESDHDSTWILSGPTGEHAFIGDLVMNGVHPYMADAHTAEWLASLHRLENMFSDGTRLYPGHGPPGGREMLGAQAAYIDRFRAEVRDIARGRASLSDEETSELERRMLAFLGHDRMSRWIHEAADPVSGELATEANP